MKLRKYTEEQLRQAVQNNSSYRAVLAEIGLAPKGGNYRTLQRAIEHFQLDTSHFTGQAWNKNKVQGPKRPLSDYLSNTHSIGSHKLRLRLLQEGVFEHECSHCKGTTWFDNPIPLELDHIDGNHSNNKLENLRLLCPNCHSLTPTYRGRNKNSKA